MKFSLLFLFETFKNDLKLSRQSEEINCFNIKSGTSMFYVAKLSTEVSMLTS